MPILTGSSGSDPPVPPPGGGSGNGPMIDLDRLGRALVLGALGAAAMALLLPPLALLRYTDGHDWYAARKVSVAEALIAVGFDEHASTNYHLADGRTVTWLRDGVATYPEALRSRSLILAVIGDNAVLGACAGFVVLFALSGLLNLARPEPAGLSRAPMRGHSAGERQPGFVEDVPPYDPHGPRSAAPVAVVPGSKPAVSAAAPAGGSGKSVVGPSPVPAAATQPGPPAEAEPERAPRRSTGASRARPPRRRGRWF